MSIREMSGMITDRKGIRILANSARTVKSDNQVCRCSKEQMNRGKSLCGYLY